MYELERIINRIIFLVFIVLVCSECDFVFSNNDGQVIRCMERESEALLKFKEGLIDKHGMLSSWGKGKECCKWEGIQCSNTTGHVIGIELVGSRSANNPRYNLPDNISYYFRGEISSALQELHNLNVLNLSGNDFGGISFPKFISSMSQLQHLDLHSSNFSGTLPLEIWNLTNLRTLDLSSNQFSGTFPSETGNLNNLRTLDLSSNQFSGTLPSELGNLTNLRTLYLSFNQFSKSLPAEIGNLSSLRTLSLSWNHFSGIVPSHLWSLANLEYLYLSGNDLTSSATDTLFNMSKYHVAPSLKVLDLRSNKLKRLPSSIWQFSMLEELVVSSNSLEDTITEAHLAKLHNLKVLYLSFNSLALDINPDWIPRFQLSEIGLSGCNVGPHFPSWIQTQSSFKTLDLSNNDISGEVPEWFWSLSHEVNYLDVSNNQLAGKLPNCWENMTELVVLNVANNNFSGEIPHALGYLLSLRSLRLANNSFYGEIPSNLKNCKQLQLIDMRDNMLTGSIPTWIGEYGSTLYLILRNNRFDGNIPLQICYLSHINVLDLSGNNLSGQIPSCFNNFSHFVMDISSNEFDLTSFKYSYYEVTEYTTVLWKGTDSEYGLRNLYFLRLIDLSCNRLVGNIPPSFWYLMGLNSLNLSMNRLTGTIDPCIGQMQLIESLDLSSNQISGEIPAEIAQLNFLCVLDLSNNSLSGKIPIGSQLQTFPASAYARNTGLCGNPLHPCPGDSLNSSNNNEARNVDVEYEGGILSFSFLKEFGASVILGFIFGFWGVIGSLTVKESWRMMFYNLYDWLFVWTAILWTRLRRSL